MPNFLKISEIIIFVQDEYLIFSIEIPLISSREYNVYRLISLPIVYSTNTLILIEPEIDYLVINNDNEEFFSLTGKQWETCVNLGTYKLCKGGQTFHRRSRSNNCEVALLAHQKIPETCKIKFVMITTPIWDKLMDSNAWLFYTEPTLVTIKCVEPPQIATIEISGIGRLTTSQDCEINTENSIIFPTSRSNRGIYTDLMPGNKKQESLLIESLKNIIPQSLKDTSIIHDFNSLSRKLVEINKLQKVTTDSSIIFQMEFHLVLVYILILTVVSVASGLAIKFRNRISSSLFVCFYNLSSTVSSLIKICTYLIICENSSLCEKSGVLSNNIA
uniref:Envelope fusion protein n=1 Tax=Schizaphis graminum TaxID=13262 RepID=A0A2S2PSM8_SCHGA